MLTRARSQRRVEWDNPVQQVSYNGGRYEVTSHPIPVRNSGATALNRVRGIVQEICLRAGSARENPLSTSPVVNATDRRVRLSIRSHIIRIAAVAARDSRYATKNTLGIRGYLCRTRARRGGLLGSCNES